MKKSTKIMNAGMTFLLLAALELINYLCYAFAYQIADLIGVLAMCVVLHFFAKKTQNCVMIWGIAAICLGIFIGFRPAYTLKEAEALIKEQYPDNQDPALDGLIDETSEQDKIIKVKDYVFTWEGVEDTEKIIVSPRSGQISVME